MPRRERQQVTGVANFHDLSKRVTVSALDDAERRLFDDDADGSIEERKQRVFYQTHPLDYFVDKLGCDLRTLIWSANPEYANHVWDGDVDPMKKVTDALVANMNVAVESATGTGKTRLGAMTALWFLDVFRPSIVVTTAPKEGQLTLHLWKEIGVLWKDFKRRNPSAELSKLRLLMDAPQMNWGIFGFACAVSAGEDSATRAQGFHAKHMLVITEETPGIDGAIMTAFENTCVAEHNRRLAFGNPDSQSDQLHVFFNKSSTVGVRISALDHPNVVCDNPDLVPGAVTARSVKEKAADYGIDSRLYKSRVRGICPSDSADALIKWSWLVAANKKPQADIEKLKLTSPRALGVDVANSKNGDKAAIADGLGSVCLTIDAFQCEDANLLGMQVVRRMTASMWGQVITAKRVGIDTVGIGAGAYNEAKRLGFYLHALYGSAAAKKQWSGRQAETFANLRSQMWWQLRLDLQAGLIWLPDDPELWQDLCEPEWGTPNGKITVESKDHIKARLGRSPNKGDAVVYWNWVRQAERAMRGHADLVTF